MQSKCCDTATPDSNSLKRKALEWIGKKLEENHCLFVSTDSISQLQGKGDTTLKAWHANAEEFYRHGNYADAEEKLRQILEDEEAFLFQRGEKLKALLENNVICCKLRRRPSEGPSDCKNSQVVGKEIIEDMRRIRDVFRENPDPSDEKWNHLIMSNFVSCYVKTRDFEKALSSFEDRVLSCYAAFISNNPRLIIENSIFYVLLLLKKYTTTESASLLETAKSSLKNAVRATEKITDTKLFHCFQSVLACLFAINGEYYKLNENLGLSAPNVSSWTPESCPPLLVLLLERGVKIEHYIPAKALLILKEGNVEKTETVMKLLDEAGRFFKHIKELPDLVYDGSKFPFLYTNEKCRIKNSKHQLHVTFSLYTLPDYFAKFATAGGFYSQLSLKGQTRSSRTSRLHVAGLFDKLSADDLHKLKVNILTLIESEAPAEIYGVIDVSQSDLKGRLDVFFTDIHKFIEEEVEKLEEACKEDDLDCVICSKTNIRKLICGHYIHDSCLESISWNQVNECRTCGKPIKVVQTFRQCDETDGYSFKGETSVSNSPDEVDVRSLLHWGFVDKLSPKWRFIARRLGIAEEKIEIIDTECDKLPEPTREKCYRMFKSWHEEKGRNATYEELIRVMKKEGRLDLISDLKLWLKE